MLTKAHLFSFMQALLEQSIRGRLAVNVPLLLLGACLKQVGQHLAFVGFVFRAAGLLVLLVLAGVLLVRRFVVPSKLDETRVVVADLILLALSCAAIV